MKRFLQRLCGALTRTSTDTNAPQQGADTKHRQPQQDSRLLELPVELVFAITDLLPPEDTAALSLSCKCLLYTLSPPFPSLRYSQRECLLVRLERDLGASHFYCLYCSALHGFLSLPGCDDSRGYRLNSCLDIQFHPPLTPFWLRYHHGRLVMNRHFYGAPSGLPLESLNMVAVGFGMNDSLARRKWVTETTGAIIQDELVLYVKYTLESTDLDTLWAQVATRYYWICSHLRTHGGDIFKSCLIETGDVETNHDAGSQPPQRVVIQHGSGSCDMCTTDFAFEVTTRETQGVARHAIAVYSYHLMGSFRSRQDPRWRTMADIIMGPWSEANSSWVFFRNMIELPPGSVRRLWLDHAGVS